MKQIVSSTWLSRLKKEAYRDQIIFERSQLINQFSDHKLQIITLNRFSNILTEIPPFLSSLKIVLKMQFRKEKVLPKRKKEKMNDYAAKNVCWSLLQ